MNILFELIGLLAISAILILIPAGIAGAITGQWAGALGGAALSYVLLVVADKVAA